MVIQIGRFLLVGRGLTKLYNWRIRVRNATFANGLCQATHVGGDGTQLTGSAVWATQTTQCGATEGSTKVEEEFTSPSCFFFFFSGHVSEQPVLQQVARKAQGSFRMSESTLCFSQGHVLSLCHSTSTGELGNEKFAA